MKFRKGSKFINIIKNNTLADDFDVCFNEALKENSLSLDNNNENLKSFIYTIKI